MVITLGIGNVLTVDNVNKRSKLNRYNGALLLRNVLVLLSWGNGFDNLLVLAVHIASAMDVDLAVLLLKLKNYLGGIGIGINTVVKPNCDVL